MLQNNNIFVMSEKYNIYLKEINKLLLKISVPSFKSNSNKIISNWEILEKIHSIVQPHIFIQLRVISNSIEEIKLEGEVHTEAEVIKIAKILNNKRMKLSGFSDSFTITTSIFLSEHPNKQDWNLFFQDYRHLDRPGERPDTLHIKGLPTLWFAEKSSNKPSQLIVEEVFSRLGRIRAIYIPSTNPMLQDCNGAFGSVVSMNCASADSVTTLLTFEAFIQYRNVSDFTSAMMSLKNKKLVYKDVKVDLCSLPIENWYNADIVVDYDRRMHLSESSILKRNAAINEYHKKLKEEAENTRKKEEALKEKIKRQDRKKRKYEEERKRKIRKQEEENKRIEIQKQIEQDKTDLLIAQRNVESIRLLSALLEIIKFKEEAEILRSREIELECARQKLLAEEKLKLETESIESTKDQMRKKEELLRKELELRRKLMKKLNEQKCSNITIEKEHIVHRKKRKH